MITNYKMFCLSKLSGPTVAFLVGFDNLETAGDKLGLGANWAQMFTLFAACELSMSNCRVFNHVAIDMREGTFAKDALFLINSARNLNKTVVVICSDLNQLPTTVYSAASLWIFSNKCPSLPTFGCCLCLDFDTNSFSFV
jgi:hypothetical protein